MDLIARTLFTDPYEEGEAQPSSVLTLPDGNPARVRLFRGWPLDAEINADARAMVSNVSVYVAPERARDLTMYLQQMQVTDVSQAPITLTVATSGNKVTFGGTGSPSQVIGVSTYPDTAHSSGYAMRLTNTATPQQVATALAAHLPQGHVTVNGATLEFSVPFRCDTGGDVTRLIEVGRQEQVVQVDVWTPTVQLRDQICSAIDGPLRYTREIQFSDGSVSYPVFGAGNQTDDLLEKDYLWRRIMFFKVIYGTYYKQVLPVMVLGIENIESLSFKD